MLLGRKNHYCENDYTTKCNLQIQYNTYQNTSGIFDRMRRKYFTIHMEIEKTKIDKVVLRKKNGTGGITFLTSDYTTKLQSSRQYGIGTKTEI